MFHNPNEAALRDLLQRARTIAVVGFSVHENRPSHWIAVYLKEQGYVVFPVNPGLETALGGPCYPSLGSVPEKVDIVNIFRSPPQVPAVVEDAIRIGAGSVWMQEGAASPAAATMARDAGLVVIMERCIYRDHMALIRKI